MDDSLLEKVVAVEREVQENIAREQQLARTWLDNAKREAEEKLESAEKKLQDECDRAANRSITRSRERAQEIVRKAQDEAQRLQGLQSSFLKDLILPHISRLVPGECHDRQDVKS